MIVMLHAHVNNFDHRDDPDQLRPISSINRVHAKTAPCWLKSTAITSYVEEGLTKTFICLPRICFYYLNPVGDREKLQRISDRNSKLPTPSLNAL
jgi:hypothetical protein